LTISGAGTGYVIDFFRQRRKRLKEQIEKYLKLKKKIDKVSKKNKYIKPKK